MKNDFDRFGTAVEEKSKMIGNMKLPYSDEFEADPVTISMEISSLAKNFPVKN